MLALSVFTLATLLAPAPDATYRVDSGKSRITVHVGRAGLFSFAGHEHVVISTAVEGQVIARAEDVSAARVELRFATSGLKVSGKGEPPEDVPQVQSRMEGGEVLDIVRFPEATYTSRHVTGKASGPGHFTLTIEGDFTLRGMTRKLEVPVAVSVEGDVLTATGTAVLRHDEYGMKPISVAGVVKVKNEIDIEFTIVARREGAPPASP
jgi:polyisoprenoid-binding protein YceI